MLTYIGSCQWVAKWDEEIEGMATVYVSALLHPGPGKPTLGLGVLMLWNPEPVLFRTCLLTSSQIEPSVDEAFHICIHSYIQKYIHSYLYTQLYILYKNTCISVHDGFCRSKLLNVWMPPFFSVPLDPGTGQVTKHWLPPTAATLVAHVVLRTRSLAKHGSHQVTRSLK